MGASLLATLAWAVLTLGVRPLDGSEGNILFDAARIREKLPLYVDPLVGASEYGAPPARYFVYNTPTWAWLLAQLTSGSSPVPSRLLGTLLWFGTLAAAPLTAPRVLRAQAALAALFVASVWVLALFGASGRADAPAVALAGVALLRSVRRGRVGPLEAALFSLAPFVKPNVLSLAAGAFAAEIALRRRKAWPAVLSAALTAGAMIAILHLATGGQWIGHVVRSTYGKMDLAFWWSQARARLQFFAAPLAFAALCAWRSRAESGANIALFAIATSTGWTLLQIAKAASASNYWMEPMVAFVVAMSHAPLPPLTARGKAAACALALWQSLWTGVASVRSSVEGLSSAPARALALASARDACGARPAELLVADEPGLELMLNGRLVQTAVQFAYQSRIGRFPVATWIADLTHERVAGVVLQNDLLERPLTQDDPEQDLFVPEVRAALRETFALAKKDAGLYVYCRRR
jgi:hypothetical protein